MEETTEMQTEEKNAADGESKATKRDCEPEVIHVLVKSNKEGSVGRDILLNNDVFKIGRANGNNEVLLHVSISRNHCTLQKKDSKWTIIDSSSSGTFLNGIKLLPNIVYPLTLNDELEFGDTKLFHYTFKTTQKEESPEAKRARLEQDLMAEVLAKQKVFKEHQDAQMKEMQEKIALKQKQTEDLTTTLEELVKQQEVVQGESEEKNNQIKALEEQIKSTKDNQSQLEDNLKQLVDSMTTERRQFEEKLSEERRKWQEQLNMTVAQKQAFERNMVAQMNTWQQQQLAAVATEKEALMKKLRDTENALKEQAAIAEQFRSQTVILSQIASDKDYVVFKVDGENMETIDLTNDKPSTSKVGAEVNSKIMNAMDEQFTCSICQELFVMATTLNCTHTFCAHCIRSWRKKRQDCPICRAGIVAMNRALVLDNFIDDAVSNLPEPERRKREELVKERRALEQPPVVLRPVPISAVPQAIRRGGVVTRGRAVAPTPQQVQRAPPVVIQRAEVGNRGIPAVRRGQRR